MQKKAKEGGGRREGRGSREERGRRGRRGRGRGKRGKGRRRRAEEEEVTARQLQRKQSILHFPITHQFNMRGALSEQDSFLEVPGPQDRGVGPGKGKQATWQLKSLGPGAPPSRCHS